MVDFINPVLLTPRVCKLDCLEKDRAGTIWLLWSDLDDFVNAPDSSIRWVGFVVRVSHHWSEIPD